MCRFLTLLTLVASVSLAALANAGDSGADGLWSGEMRQVNAGAETVYPMTVRITGSSGDVSYSTLKCAGRWDIIATAHGQSVWTETITSNRADQNPDNGCLDGVVVSKVEGSQLIVGWAGTYEGTPYVATAVLAAQVTP